MTKYCLFDSGDIVGPFTVKQLLLRAGFGDNSLVCPEEHTAEDAYWKEARHYPEFGFRSSETESLLPPVLVVPPAAQADQFSDELNNAVSELDAFDVLGSAQTAGTENAENIFSSEPAEPKPVLKKLTPKVSVSENTENANTVSAIDLPSEEFLEQAAKEIQQEPVVMPQAVKPLNEQEKPVPASPTPPTSQETMSAAAEQVTKQTVTAASPLEEYFDTMRTGDLGNILGMPDPKLNSDLNLARTLEKQEAQNVLPDPQPASEPELVNSTSKQEPQQPKAEDVVSAPAMEETPAVSENQPLESTDMTPAVVASQSEQPAKTAPITKEQEPAAVVPETEEKSHEMTQEDQDAQTVRNILAGTLRVQKNQEVPEPIKQVPAPESEEELVPQQFPLEQRVVPHQEETTGKHWYSHLWMISLAVGVLVLITAACVWRYTYPVRQADMEELLPPAQTILSTSQPAAAPAPAVEKTRDEIAKEVVQQYPLDSVRGSISQYLEQRYSAKLAEGYVQQWSAEPLHRDVYVVKYRLTKTRQEPIVYIFQVDTAKKQLTGALNNITLDLVGKLN